MLHRFIRSTSADNWPPLWVHNVPADRHIINHFLRCSPIWPFVCIEVILRLDFFPAINMLLFCKAGYVYHSLMTSLHKTKCSVTIWSCYQRSFSNKCVLIMSLKLTTFSLLLRILVFGFGSLWNHHLRDFYLFIFFLCSDRLLFTTNFC